MPAGIVLPHARQFEGDEVSSTGIGSSGSGTLSSMPLSRRIDSPRNQCKNPQSSHTYMSADAFSQSRLKNVMAAVLSWPLVWVKRSEPQCLHANRTSLTVICFALSIRAPILLLQRDLSRPPTGMMADAAVASNKPVSAGS